MNTPDDSILPDLSIKSKNFKAESGWFIDIKRAITKLYDLSSGTTPVCIILSISFSATSLSPAYFMAFGAISYSSISTSKSRSSPAVAPIIRFALR